MSFVRKIATETRQYDWVIVAVVGVLSAIGFASIYSIDLSRGESLVYSPTQVLAFLIGVGVLFFAARVHMSFYQSSAKLVYVFAVLLLVSVLFFGESVRGTTGWFRFGGLSFQPVEFAKVALVITFGLLIQLQARRFDKLQYIVLSALTTFVLILPILFQPDLGSALVFGGVWFGILLFSGTKKRYMLALVAIIMLVFVAAWFLVLEDYQKNRILTFADPSRDILGSGYNVNQSIIAIGSGQILGRGLGFGSQSQLHFLPEAQTDFIFSVISEELGFLGSFTVLVLYALLLWRLAFVAKACRSDFGAYLVLGIAIVFLVQIVFNVGAATGMLPLTGLTLPFLSYGGSSLVMNLLLIGIVESVARSNWENQRDNVLYG